MTSTLWTIGHSTRSIDELLAALKAHEIEALVDVRRFPGSRRLPQFGSEPLHRSLSDAGIEYRWLPSLGGRRNALPDSPNTGWRVAGFRGYADHMDTEEFAEGLAELAAIAEGVRATIMCAEILWWQCHRRLISDLMVSLGWSVLHIRDGKLVEPHRIAPPARLVSGRLSYASEELELDLG